MRPWSSSDGIMETSSSGSIRWDSTCTARRSTRSSWTPKCPTNLHDVGPISRGWWGHCHPGKASPWGQCSQCPCELHLQWGRGHRSARGPPRALTYCPHVWGMVHCGEKVSVSTAGRPPSTLQGRLPAPQDPCPRGEALEAWPRSHCSQAWAHAPLGSQDPKRHNQEGAEAARADGRQHHDESDEGLAAEAQAAVTVGSRCRDRATGGPVTCLQGLLAHPHPEATRRTWAGWPCLQKGGAVAGGGTCSRDEQKGQTYQAQGAASQAAVRVGTGGHVQPPAPQHTCGRNSSEGSDLTVGCEAGRVGAGPQHPAGLSLTHPWAPGSEESWAGAGREEPWPDQRQAVGG